MAGIYIHIPFCKQKCAYCDFASFPNEVGKCEAYFACLYKEMKSRSQALKGKTFNTVYFGGGTPSFVDAKFILGCMRLVKEHFNLDKNAEITLEVNPGTIDRQKLRIYKMAGINRYSIGLQTADDLALQKLNRIHTIEDFLKATDILKEYNFSVDVMIGLPDQTESDVLKTLDVAINSGAKHISVYALTPEDGTPMYSRYLNGDLPDGDTVAEFYELAVKHLKENGFNRYEVSNFCKEGFYSRHNLNYWKRGEYIGFGVAASSFIDGRRFTNVSKIDEYVHLLLNDKFAEIASEKIEGREAKCEYAMLKLRTAEGVIFKEYSSLFGSDFTKDFKDAIFSQKKYLDLTENSIRIKDEFLYVQNSIIVYFLE